jgi:hypothetical protein
LDRLRRHCPGLASAALPIRRDPRTLAALARTRMKAKHDDLVEALAGMSGAHHGELAGLLLDQIAFPARASPSSPPGSPRRPPREESTAPGPPARI